MSEKAKHTPGPWEADFGLDGRFQVTGKGGHSGSDSYVVCSRSSHGIIEETHANARLIAAAPELLQALIDVLPYAKAAIGETWRAAPPSDSVITAAERAIEKATNAKA